MTQKKKKIPSNQACGLLSDGSVPRKWKFSIESEDKTSALLYLYSLPISKFVRSDINIFTSPLTTFTLSSSLTKISSSPKEKWTKLFNQLEFFFDPSSIASHGSNRNDDAKDSWPPSGQHSRSAFPRNNNRHASKGRITSITSAFFPPVTQRSILFQTNEIRIRRGNWNAKKD